MPAYAHGGIELLIFGGLVGGFLIAFALALLVVAGVSLLVMILSLAKLRGRSKKPATALGRLAGFVVLVISAGVFAFCLFIGTMWYGFLMKQADKLPSAPQEQTPAPPR